VAGLERHGEVIDAGHRVVAAILVAAAFFDRRRIGDHGREPAEDPCGDPARVLARSTSIGENRCAGRAQERERGGRIGDALRNETRLGVHHRSSYAVRHRGPFARR
jgi:hypothetical protein